VANPNGAQDNPNDAQDEETPDDDTHQEYQEKRIALPEENHLVEVAERIKNFNFEGGKKLRVLVRSFGGREQIVDACVDDEVCTGW